jgi:hypothetical protein
VVKRCVCVREQQGPIGVRETVNGVGLGGNRYTKGPQLLLLYGIAKSQGYRMEGVNSWRLDRCTEEVPRMLELSALRENGTSTSH